MQWDEFKALLVGISPDTALGRIVSIRAEEDKDILKNFTKDQRRIRNEWRMKHQKERSIADRDKFLEQMKQAFMQMAGGVTNAS